MSFVLESFFGFLQRTSIQIQGKGQQDEKNNFYPVFDEVHKQDMLVQGKIPEDLDGAYLRNGANAHFKDAGDEFVFDGDGMLHSVLIKDGKITFSNSYVRTEVFEAESKYGYPLFVKIGQLKGVTGMIIGMLGILRQLFGIVKSSKKWEINNAVMGQANTSIYYIQDRLLALNEADLPYQVKMLCNGIIQTLGLIHTGKFRTMTAHPHIDLDTNEAFFISYSMTPPYYQYGIIDANNKISKPIDIKFKKPSMAHDFGLSKKHVVFIEPPLELKLSNIIVKNTMPISYNKDAPIKFGIMDRYAKSIEGLKWFSLPNQMIFHVGNVYDESPSVVVMYAATFSEIVLEASQKDPNGDANNGYLVEYRFDLSTNKATSRKVSTVSVEFPVINLRLTGQKTKYMYAAVKQNIDTDPYIGFAKFDLTDASNVKEYVVYYGKGVYGGEMFFQPKQSSNVLQGEDDGYLMGYLHDYNRDTSMFAVYNAKTMNNQPIFKVDLPQRVPYGFHGSFITREQIKMQSSNRYDFEEQ